MTGLARRVLAAAGLALVLAPTLALLVASVAEVGPTGGVRASAVRWALTVADPFAAACLWNSLAVATLAVALGAASGVAMARIALGFVGWRGRIARLLLRVPAGCHPAYAAVGLALLGPPLGTLAGEMRPGLAPGADDLWRWLGLGLAQFGFASAWVAVGTARALGRVRPEWRWEAARSGAPAGWVWRTSTWPLVRPTVARASASAFAVLVLEPGGPLVLGLRRTLGFQVASSAWMTSRPDWPMAALLSAVGLLAAVLARGLLVRWGGPDALPPADPDPVPAARRPAAPAAPGRVRSAVATLAFSAWLLVVLAPGLALLVAAGRSLPDAAALRPLIGPEGPGPIVGALGFGGMVALLTIGLAWPISAGRRSRSAAALLDPVPPLALGVGLLGLAELLRSVATGPGSPPDPALGATLRAIDPYRSPWLLSGWATAAALLPWALGLARRCRSLDADALQDLARLSGSRLARSRTLLLAPIAVRLGFAPALGIALAAAGSLAPALVLAPLGPFRPAGATLLLDPGLGPGPLLVLAAFGLVMQTLGVLLLTGRDLDGPDASALRT